jgi:uncharacterized protein YbjT (DUF2867 family)
MTNRILVFGATGRTGQHVIKLALEKGFQVNVLVRNAAKMNLKSDQLVIFEGLPTNLNDVRVAMEGCDGLISLLSALPEKESFSFRKIVPPHTLEISISNAIQVMKELKIKRIMALSSIGVGDSYVYAPLYMKLMLKITNFKLVFADHNAQERQIQQSGLDWTIARPVGLNNFEGSNTLLINYDKTPKPFKLSRQQLAKFFINNFYTNTYHHKAPMLSES